MVRLLGPAVGALACFLSSAENRDAAALVQSAIRVHRDAEEETVPDPKAKAKAVAAKPAAKPVAKASHTFHEGPVSTGKIMPVNFHHMVNSMGTGDDIDGSLIINYTSKNGRSPDCIGERCYIKWGDTVALNFVADMPHGLQEGDQLTLHMTLNFQEPPETNPLKPYFSSDTLTMDMNCQLCTGSCYLDADWGYMSFRGHAPTAAISNDYCHDDGRVKAGLNKIDIMKEWTISMPADVGITLADFSADWNYQVGLLRKSGLRRAFVSKRTMLGKVTDRTIEEFKKAAQEFTKKGADLKKEGTPAALMQVSSTAREHVYRAAERLRDLTGPLDLTKAIYRAMWEVVANMAQEEPQATQLSLLSEKMESSGKRNPMAMVTTLKINELENGSPYNFTITSPNCKNFEGSYGGFSCAFPLGSEVETSMNVQTAATIEPGSKLRFKVEEPKVDGLMGIMIKAAFSKLGKMEIELPLCGPEYVTKYGGQTITMKTAKCGHHQLDMTVKPNKAIVPGPEMMKSVFLPGNIKFPEAILNLAWTAATHMQMIHADGRVIADMTLESGLHRMGM